MKCPTCEGTGAVPDITSDSYQKIINDLNAKAGTRYQTKSQKTRKLIAARMREGFKCEDFFHVHDVKINDWQRDKDLCKYIRPETLYGSKFESYRNQLKPKPIINKVAY
jgi:uncharacterized phage protein (TIGR02220 family)|tara:strand:- start:227 stop:553 length:327 start_codon:yes stop_codon:yes gene_type:complete